MYCVAKYILYYVEQASLVSYSIIPKYVLYVMASVVSTPKLQYRWMDRRFATYALPCHAMFPHSLHSTPFHFILFHLNANPKFQFQTSFSSTSCLLSRNPNISGFFSWNNICVKFPLAIASLPETRSAAASLLGRPKPIWPMAKMRSTSSSSSPFVSG
jgi:hypothetical protein